MQAIHIFDSIFTILSRAYIRGIKRPYEVRYDPYTQSIQILDNKNIIQETAKLVKIELNSLNAALSRIDYLSVGTNWAKILIILLN